MGDFPKRGKFQMFLFFSLFVEPGHVHRCYTILSTNFKHKQSLYRNHTKKKTIAILTSYKMSEYTFDDLLEFIPKPIKHYNKQKNDFTSDPSISNSTYLNNTLGFINSLVFSLISSSNNKKNTNNLFINTDDLLQNLKNEHDQHSAKNLTKINNIYKRLEAQLIHNLINFSNDLDDIQVNVLYVNNLYTPRDDSFL